MTILFSGAEDIDFVASTTFSIFTVSNYYQASYSRLSLRATGTTGYMSAPVDFSVNEAWLHFCGCVYTQAGSSIRDAFGFSNNTLGLVAAVQMVMTGSTAQFSFRINNGAGVSLLSTANVEIGSLGYNYKSDYDLHVKIEGLALYIAVYRDGEMKLSETFTLVQTYSLTNIRLLQGSQYDTWGWCYSQVIVATESTINWKLKTLVPTGAGDLSEFSGTFADIDEATLNTTDAISTDVSAQSTFTAEAWSLPTDYEVAEVKLSSYAISSDVTGSYNHSLRLGGATYKSPATLLEPSYSRLTDKWSVNPATSSKWTPGDLAGLQFGVGVEL